MTDNNRLRELLCKADSACQNEGWVCAYYLTHEILFICPDYLENKVIGIRNYLRKKNYKKAHDLIKEMLRDTYPADDELSSQYKK